MEDKTDNSQKKEEHDSLKPARDAIATAMRAAQFAKAIGTPLPKPLKWQREFMTLPVCFHTAGMSARYAGTGQIGNRTPVRFATHY